MFLRTISIPVPACLDIDSPAAVREAFSAAESADEAIFDFSQLSTINAGVLGALVGVINRMVERDRLGVVRIVGASPEVYRVFALCNAEMLFDFGPAPLPIVGLPSHVS